MYACRNTALVCGSIASSDDYNSIKIMISRLGR
jgi:hypothetical protein